MIDAYVSALLRVLGGFVSKLVVLSMPLAILFGIILAAVYLRNKDEAMPKVKSAWPYLLFAMVFATGWTLLREVRDIQRGELEWEASAEATEKPKSDAPQIYQYSPSAVRVVEKTYTRTLSLPPDFAEQIGTGGLGVLSPYLTDPTTKNVLKMVDSFKRSGKDVLFTRELTRMDEEPVGFKNSSVKVGIKRSYDRGYEAAFTGSYTFENLDKVEHVMKFVFPLSMGGGTVRNLTLKVGADTVTEPDDSGNYMWQGFVGAGKERTVEVSYVAAGSSSWTYDMGSTRRTVREFTLAADVDGPFRFPRGTIEPVSRSDKRAEWQLSNVVTAQRIGLSFPKDTNAQDGYLQGLATLPLAFGLILALCMTVSSRLGVPFRMGPYVSATVLLGFAFLSVPVMYGYIGPVAVLICPLLGAFGLGFVLDTRCTVPAMMLALIPAAMLSPTHSGLLILVIGLACGAMMLRLGTKP